MKNNRYNVLQKKFVIPAALAVAALTGGGNAAACGDAPEKPTIGTSEGGRVTVEVGSYQMSYGEDGYGISSKYRCMDPQYAEHARAVTQAVKAICAPESEVSIEVNLKDARGIVQESEEGKKAAYARLEPIVASECASLTKAADAIEAKLPPKEPAAAAECGRPFKLPDGTLAVPKCIDLRM